ncbi:MAG: NAD(P)/FAD-dependent oxidoreductase [Acidimicrobiales bacterium]|nr:NAD(P)/FAD-dependent oxidoreductase [Acidimicrobiales bacterium]
MTAAGHDVAIIGGGVVGCALAHELTRHRIDVTLLERATEVGFGTSKANSGIIHGGHHASPTTLKGRLEWIGNQRWGDLCDELGFGFARVGELTVALSEADLPTLDHLVEQAEAKGVPGVERWDRDRVLAAEPNLTTDVVAAVHGPTTAVINPYEACFGLAEQAVHQGLVLRTDCPVLGLARNGDTWVIRTPAGPVHARYVLNAAGVFADAVATMAGVGDFTIRPRKGEEYLLDKRLAGLVHRVIYPCPTPTTKGTLVIPTYDGTIMIGPTADLVDDPDDVTTSADGADRVLAAARRLVPGISDRDVIAQFAGVRAVLDSEDFLIGPTAAPGFVNVAGIQSPGLTAAPAIAELVVDLLRAQGLELAPAAGPAPPLPRPVHFASLPTEDQRALAERDPRYRRIVCRCEFVTEGEVLDAIDRGARTLDGLKFRTRTGMGRCQGGFCTSRCMELLAHDQGAPLSAVTKRGGGSWLVLERDEVQGPGPDTGGAP